MVGRCLFEDTLLRWAYIYWGTHCYGGQIFISGPIVMVGRYFFGTQCNGGQMFLGRHIVKVGRYLLGDTLLWRGRYFLGDTLL